MREYRLKAGLSQEELASRGNLHRTYVGSIERGEKAISVEAALKLCDGLGVKASDFFGQLDKD